MKDKWKMKHMSLRGQILRLSAAASILVCACVAAFIIGLGYTNQQQLDRSVEQAAEILSGEITSYQEELENIAELVAYNGLMLRLSQTSDLVNITSGANNVNDLLSIVLSCNDSAANVIVTDFGNLVLGVDSGEYSSLYAAKNYLETNPGTNRAHISYQKNGGASKEYLYLLRSLPSAAGNQYYTIVVYNMEQIKGFVEKLDSSGCYRIVDHEGNLVAGNELTEESGRYRTESAVRCELPDSDWCIIGYSMDYTQSVQYRTAARTALIVLTVFLLFICIMARMIIHNLTGPVAVITDFMKTYGAQRERGMRLTIQAHNELMDISTGINDMLDELEKASTELVEATKIIYRAKVEKQRSELIALQIQINPHFLFNTLNCIYGIAAAHQEREISEIVVSMAKIMRYSLGSEKYTTLHEEMESVRNYCRIIKTRYHDRVEIFFQEDETVKNAMIPKMILQPIVENAVAHGLEQDNERGSIWVESRRENGALVICVSNTGLPITPEQERRVNLLLKEYVDSEGNDVISATHNIGMRNVHARLQILYRKKAGVRFSAREGGGAVVRLAIPDTKPEDIGSGAGSN